MWIGAKHNLLKIPDGSPLTLDGTHIITSDVECLESCSFQSCRWTSTLLHSVPSAFSSCDNNTASDVRSMMTPSLCLKYSCFPPLSGDFLHVYFVYTVDLFHSLPKQQFKSFQPLSVSLDHYPGFCTINSNAPHYALKTIFFNSKFCCLSEAVFFFVKGSFSIAILHLFTVSITWNYTSQVLEQCDSFHTLTNKNLYLMISFTWRAHDFGLFNVNFHSIFLCNPAEVIHKMLQLFLSACHHYVIICILYCRYYLPSNCYSILHILSCFLRRGFIINDEQQWR